jgi:hypothetical protein
VDRKLIDRRKLRRPSKPHGHHRQFAALDGGLVVSLATSLVWSARIYALGLPCKFDRPLSCLSFVSSGGT